MKALEGATTTLLIVTLLSLLSSVQNPVLILLSAAAFVCSFFKVHPLFIIFGCGVIGAILGF
jgi:chromate transporter